MNYLMTKHWKPIKRPACDCTHGLSTFCWILVSLNIPDKLLPGVQCFCGRTWIRIRDRKLFATPEGCPSIRRR